MNKTISLLLLTGILSAAVLAQTVDDIIAKSVAARGGMDKLKAVHSQRLTGHISFGSEAEGILTVEMKRPDKVREELTVNGESLVRTSDGKSGWVINPFAGKAEVEPLGADEMGNMAQKSDIDRPIVGYKAKGNQVELVGKEKVEGKDAYKLKVTLKDGQVRFDYLDCDSYLEVKWEGKLTVQGKEFQAESFFRDYKPVEGVMYPFLIESDTADTKQQIVFDKVEINPALDDALFGKPIPPAPPASKAP
jgi:outer membrane lipoprotein-sorting protein